MTTKYSYKAKDNAGRIRSGLASASDAKDLARQLRKKGLILISQRGEGKEAAIGGETPILGDFIYKDAKGAIQISLGSSNPSAKELIIFSKQFATMLASGVPMIQSLGILANQQSARGFKLALKKVEQAIENGSTLSVALAAHPQIFDNLYIAMVGAGEASGNLDSILIKLTSYIEKAEKVKSQIKAAMSYPLIVFIVAMVVVTGMLIYVVPVFASQYADSGRELPFLTALIIGFSNYFQTYWWMLFCFAAILFALFRYWLKTPVGRERFDEILLILPGIGLLLKKIAVGRFCSTMSSMLQSGVNLLDGLAICAASSGNKKIEKFVLNVKEGLEQGRKFSEPLAEGGFFPEMVVSMVAVGEVTGSLDEMLAKVSEFYEEEVDLAVKAMLSMIEPIMIVFIGGVVGLIVVAMYLPIFDMANNVG